MTSVQEFQEIHAFGGGEKPIFQDEPWYHELSPVERAKVAGWAAGCPIPERLIAERGNAEELAGRYLDIVHTYNTFTTKLQEVNPVAYEHVMTPWQRFPEERPELFEPQSVPATYATYIQPIGVTVGYATPRILLKAAELDVRDVPQDEKISHLVTEVADEMKQARDSFDLTARVAAKMHDKGVTSEYILRQMFSKGLIDEHNATSMMAQMSVALKEHAPEIYAQYTAMSQEERQRAGLHMDFATLIGSRAARKERLVDPNTAVMTHGDARYVVRLRGGFIEQAMLVPDGADRGVAVLYADKDIDQARPDASFMAYPFGPSDAPGGQHGSPRWSEFHAFTDNERPHGLVFQAEQSDVRGSSVRRFVELPEPDTLVVRNEVQSNRSESEATSIAEHLYLAAEETSLEQIMINGEPITDIIPSELLRSVLVDGTPFHWAEAPTQLRIQLPNRREIEIAATAAVYEEDSTCIDKEDEVSFVIWHRPGTDSICFEPVIGYAAKRGTALHVPPRGSAVLTTVIQAIK